MCLIVYITDEIVKQIDHKKYSIGVSRTKKRYIRSNYTLPSFTIWYQDKEVNTFLLVSSFKQNKVFIDSESFSLIENIEHRRNHFHFRYWWIAVYWNYCYIQIPFCVWIYLQRSLYWYHWKHRQLLETYKVERDKISPLRAFDWLHHT